MPTHGGPSFCHHKPSGTPLVVRHDRTSYPECQVGPLVEASVRIQLIAAFAMIRFVGFLDGQDTRNFELVSGGAGYESVPLFAECLI